MIIQYIETDKSRLDKIEAALPDTDFITSIVHPEILKRMFPVLLKALKAEIEVYRAYPKKEKEPVKEASKTFNPQNNTTCFMGKAFNGNANHTDAELATYRKKVGTIDHPNWGNCTLLEIWGGDHFELYPAMVRGVFNYCYGLRTTCPTVKFHVNPLFANKKTGSRLLTEEQKEHKEYMDDLLAKAMIFGVRTAKEARKSMSRR